MYSHKRKERLANKISKIKRKRDIVKVFEIIQEDHSDDENSYVENNNGLFMLFHNLKPETYKRIEKLLIEINKRRAQYLDTITSEDCEKMEYKPYVQDEFPSEKGISPKLKYSNREKNLIKRRRYDKDLNVNLQNVVYKAFDINSVSESDKNSSES